MRSAKSGVPDFADLIYNINPNLQYGAAPKRFVQPLYIRIAGLKICKTWRIQSLSRQKDSVLRAGLFRGPEKVLGC
jgi:hypothetical protein